MLLIIPCFALVVSEVSPVCAEARNHYESLELERAVEAADRGLQQDPERPLGCLEVRALGLLVLGRNEDARAALTELFTRDPSYAVRDPSLSPSMRATIQDVRELVRPLSADIGARWLIHDSLRIDVALDGGLRGAKRVRYRTLTAPNEERREGVIDLIGRAATATVAVARGTDVATLAVSGAVLDSRGRSVHEFDRLLVLAPRPAREDVVVESGGIGWPVWLAIGVGAAAATTAIVILAQPKLPSSSGLGFVPSEP